MINRVLIRVKVVQMLYCYQLTRPERTLQQATKELQTSFERSYDLYLYLLRLMPELTNLQERMLDDAKHKFQPSAEDLNPDLRFVNNSLARAIAENQQLNTQFEDRLIDWSDDPIFLRTMLDKVLASDIYSQYMSRPSVDFDADTELWRQLMRKVILPDELLEEQCENRSLYVSTEDLDIMGQFAVKTINRIADGNPSPVSPMFKDEEDSEFGEALFVQTVRDMDDNNALIDSCISERWDSNRVAVMDRIIMCAALTEVKCFDKIPVTVTLNEYIELAKVFSTPNSGQFVNGVLNAAIKTLQDGQL